jgi:uncharacterized membrane protein
MLNGAAIGFGATSRLGFWLWYAIPIGSFLLASPIAAAGIWMAYGIARTASAGLIWAVSLRRPSMDQDWLISQRTHATDASATLMAILGLATFLLVGLWTW